MFLVLYKPEKAGKFPKTTGIYMKLFDVHTHIQDMRLHGSRDGIIKRSLAKGVTGIMCCGTREEDWAGVRDLVQRYETVKASFGIHPWFVGGRSDGWADKLERYLKEYSDAGVGEIGLDRMIQERNDKEQEAVFIEQLRIAHKYKRLVSLHCRKAWGVMPDIIRVNGGLPFGGVVHSWSGSVEMVRVFEKLGAYISFSGSVTRKNNKKAHSACQAVSRERLLIETDSPDIIPDGVDSVLNEPAYVIKVLETVAGLRGERIEDVAHYTYENAVRLFEKKNQ